jgi:hypothetical protein
VGCPGFCPKAQEKEESEEVGGREREGGREGEKHWQDTSCSMLYGLVTMEELLGPWCLLFFICNIQ